MVCEGLCREQGNSQPLSQHSFLQPDSYEQPACVEQIEVSWARGHLFLHAGTERLLFKRLMGRDGVINFFHLLQQSRHSTCTNMARNSAAVTWCHVYGVFKSHINVQSEKSVLYSFNPPSILKPIPHKMFATMYQISMNYSSVFKKFQSRADLGDHIQKHIFSIQKLLVLLDVLV